MTIEYEIARDRQDGYRREAADQRLARVLRRHHGRVGTKRSTR